MRRLVFLLLAAGALSAPAAADGMPRRAAPVPETCCQAKWNSIYLGGSIGYGFAATRFDENHADATTSGFNSLDLGGHNVTGTVVVGLDREVSRGLVIGAFADYTFGELASSLTLDYLTTKVQLQYSDTWAVGGRIGLTRSCCTLWYLTAGYTSTNVDLEGIEKRLDGYFIGGGVEQMIRDNWSLKLEYRFADYGRTNLYHTSSGCCSQNIDIESEIHSVRLGITYRFDHPR